MSGTLSISSQIGKVLFDSGSTHSFSFCFPKRLAKSPESLNFDLEVATTLGGSVIAVKVIKGCLIYVRGQEFGANLILLNMRDFDIILGIDWLVAYHEILDCFRKKVIFRIPGPPKFQVLEDQIVSSVLSAVQGDEARGHSSHSRFFGGAS